MSNEKCKLYVGNLPWSVNSASLAEYFSRVGTVVSAKVIVDKETERSKGFGFVEMSTEDEANAAIHEFSGNAELGRELTVNIARVMERRSGPSGNGENYRKY